MGSTAVAAHEYWGYLINPDKSPSPVFEQLLLGVANYINKHVAPWDTNCLTPAKLAAFYRLVGGDYDPLFLATSQSSLSFIYQSLGCFHTLQPEKDPYCAPSIPALTPQGFVRWQTVQLLLEPEEHVPFLQEAVKRFDLINPADGAPFPSILPKEVLPSQPDLDMIEWHDNVSQKLMLEAQASAARNIPPRPQMALSDVDLESSRNSSLDSRPVSDMAGYFVGGRASYRFPAFLPPRPGPPPQYPQDAPWSPERRRSSLPDNQPFPAFWPHNGPTPTSFAPYPNRPRHTPRAPSDLSVTSSDTSDTSSVTTSSASLSPVRYHTQSHVPPNSQVGRRHSTHFPPQRPQSHPQGYSPHQRQPTGAPRAKNVRWQDMDDVFDAPRYNAQGRGNDGRNVRDPRAGDARNYERGRATRSVGPMTGVGGRRYAPEGSR